MDPDALEETLGITQRPRTRSPPTRSLGNGHRITEAAWNALRHHHAEQDLATILKEELKRLQPIAEVAYRQNTVLVTNYTFNAKTDKEALWYVPNEHAGITITLPDDDHRRQRALGKDA